MAKLIKPNGDITEVSPKDGKTFNLKELQGYVEGRIDVITLGGDTTLVVNDESKLVYEPEYNSIATGIVIAHASIDSFGPPGTWSRDLNCPRDFIAGTVLVCSESELK